MPKRNLVESIARDFIEAIWLWNQVYFSSLVSKADFIFIHILIDFLGDKQRYENFSCFNIVTLGWRSKLKKDKICLICAEKEF